MCEMDLVHSHRRQCAYGLPETSGGGYLIVMSLHPTSLAPCLCWGAIFEWPQVVQQLKSRGPHRFFSVAQKNTHKDQEALALGVGAVLNYPKGKLATCITNYLPKVHLLTTSYPPKKWSGNLYSTSPIKHVGFRCKNLNPLGRHSLPLNDNRKSHAFRLPLSFTPGGAWGTYLSLIASCQSHSLRGPGPRARSQ